MWRRQPVYCPAHLCTARLAHPRLEKLNMVLPLDLLVAHDGNGYELAASSMRRAVQIYLAGDDDLAANHGKIVSLAIKQILTKKVRYQLES